MATSEADRNQRLEDLRTAVDTFVIKEQDALKNKVLVLKKILKGRTGAERLAQSSVQAAQPLVVAAINDFLTS